MIHYIVRLVKRIAVLLPGIIIAYFSVHTIYPLFDRRVSAVAAILFTYVLAAYVLIPAALRLLRIVFPAHHLPLYCVTPDGFASDPINIGIVATRAQMIEAMQAAGWFVADKHSLRNVARQAMTYLLHQHYLTEPMSSLFLFGRKQDVGFERPLVGENRRGGHRHHVRFWATTFDEGQPLSVHSIHWSPRRKHLDGERLLWLGAASRDVGISFIRHNAQVTHMIDPDTNQERDMIVGQLAPRTTTVENVTLQRPYRLANRAWRGYLLTDGVLKICTLR